MVGRAMIDPPGINVPIMTIRDIRLDLRRGLLRRVAFTAVVAIVVGVCAQIPARAADTEASRFYEDALARYERNDVAGAIVQLKNALQKDPGMLAANVLMGKALLKNGDAQGAEVTFAKALKLGADRAEVIVPMAQAYLAQGKYDTLLERITPEGLLPRDTQIEILVLRGTAQAESGNTTAALRSFDDAQSLDPKSTSVRLARANLLIRNGQVNRASALADEILKLAPNDSAAWNLRGSVAHVNGDLQAALADYAKAIALDTKNLDARVAQAGIYLDLGRLDDADRAVAELQQISPLEPRGAYLRAVVASRRNDADTVRTSLTDVVGLLDPVPKETLSRYGQLLLLGGLSHYGLGNLEKAADYLKIYVRLHPGQPGPSKLLASIYIDRRDPKSAISLLEPLRTSAQSDPQVLTLLAAAQMAERRYSQAAALLEQAVKLSGGAPDVRAEYGVSLIGNGQADLGLNQLQQAFAKDPGQAHAGVALTAMYMKRDQPKKAVEVIDAVVKREPKNVDAINLQGIAHAAAGDRAGARAAYEKVIALNPGYYGARLNLARLDVSDGKFDAGRQRLLELLKADEKNGDAMYEMGLLEDQAGHPDEAIRWLERAVAMPKQRVRAGIYLSGVLLKQRNFEQAVSVAKDAASRAPKDLPALYGLSRAQLAAGDSKGAAQTLQSMSQLVGFDPVENVSIARLQIAAGDRENALYSLDKALKGDADNLQALTLTTEAEIAGRDHAKAEKHARRVSELYPSTGVGLRLLGDLAVARGQADAAITSYRAALAKQRNVDTTVRLYRAYVAGGDTSKALAVLEQAHRENPADSVILRTLADAQLRAGQVSAARGSYERLLQKNSNDAEVLNNLAQVALRQQDKAALGYAERAYQLAKNDAAIIDTLGWILVRHGQMDRAIGLLRDARLRDSSNPEIRYHLAVALAQMGREAEARSELKEILKDGVAFDGVDDARKLQQKLGS